MNCLLPGRFPVWSVLLFDILVIEFYSQTPYMPGNMKDINYMLKGIKVIEMRISK